jgi:L-ribulokinase
VSVSPADERRSTEHGEASGVSAGEQYVIGVDYGTLSGRALVVRVSDGAELGSAVHEYEHAVTA